MTAPTAQPGPSAGRRYDVVAFDFDGTIADSFHSIYETLTEVFSDAGLAVPPPAAVRAALGLPLEDIVLVLLPDVAREPERAAALARDYRRRYPALAERLLRPFPGLRGVLDALQAAHVRLAIVSNKDRKNLLLSLEYIGVAADFELVLGANDLVDRKPHPAPLWRVQQTFGTAPARGLMVGDGDVDIDMAHRAGWDACAVTFGMHAAERLRALQPRHVIDALGELLPLVLPPSAPSAASGAAP